MGIGPDCPKDTVDISAVHLIVGFAGIEIIPDRRAIHGEAFISASHDGAVRGKDLLLHHIVEALPFPVGPVKTWPSCADVNPAVFIRYHLKLPHSSFLVPNPRYLLNFRENSNSVPVLFLFHTRTIGIFYYLKAIITEPEMLVKHFLLL